jgi:hypothetical protein
MTRSRASSAPLLLAGATLTLMAELSAAQTSDTATSTEASRYCSELQEVTGIAMSKSRFTSIARKPREGNFLDTSLPLPGWNDCSLYGTRTYTCDSPGLPSREAAESAQAATLLELKACLGAGWSEALDRSSPNYVVLHDAWHPVSITLSTDETEQRQHVVRITIFRRGN